MNLYYSGKSYRRSHRRSRLPRFLAASACIVLIGVLGTGLFFLKKQHQNLEPGSTSGIVISTEPDNSEAPTEGDGFVMPDTPAQTCSTRPICWLPVMTMMPPSNC